MAVIDRDWYTALRVLLDGGHTAQPSGLSTLLNRAVRSMGVRMTVYLADIEQRALHVLPAEDSSEAEPLAIDGSLGGRAFTTLRPVIAAAAPGRIWVPIVDGTERLGVLEASVPRSTDLGNLALMEGIEAIAGLLGHLLVAKAQYGDSLSRARRTHPMSTAAETISRLLPPLTFTTSRLSISAILEPAYAVGGDAFDYAVDDDVARFAIYDAVGHGLRAALTAAVTLGAARTARVQRRSLDEVARAVDAAIMGEFDDVRFSTAVLAQLDLATGQLFYMNAGHPPPVLIRNGHVVAELDQGRRLPLGLGTDGHAAEVAGLSLEPEDRVLLYTDGFTEARDASGDQFGLDRLIDLAERHASAGLGAAETLRRLTHQLLEYQHGVLQDDATLMIVSWLRPYAEDPEIR